MQSDNTKTVLFGMPKDTQTPVETKTETSTAVNESVLPNPKKETETEPLAKTPETVKPVETTAKEEVKSDVSPAKESPQETKPALKVDFGNQKQETKPEATAPREETPTVSESQVLDYLKNNGLKVEKLSDLTQKVELNEQVEKFRKFNEETGLGAKEYYSLNRDWSSEPKESRILEYLKLNNPNLSDSDIQVQLELLAVTEDDEQELSENELKRKKLEFNKLDAKALGFLKQKQKEFEPPKNVNREVTSPTEEDIAKAHRPYWDSRDKSLSTFNEVKFNIEGMGEINIPVTEEDKKLISENTQTLDSMVNRWKKDDGLNTDSLVKDNGWGIESIRQKWISSIVEQTNALTLENFSKENRHVDLDKTPSSASETNQNERLIIQRPKNRQKEKFGTPLV